MEQCGVRQIDAYPANHLTQIAFNRILALFVCCTYVPLLLCADNLSNIAFLAQNLNLQQTQRITKVLSSAMFGVAASIPSEISNHGIPRDSPPSTCEDACDVEHARLLEEEEALAQDGLLDHDENDFSDQD